MTSSSNIKNTIFFGEQCSEILNNYIAERSPSKIFILCDENTQEHCVPLFFQQLSAEHNSELIEIESGEEQKNIATCQQLWATLSELDADRDSVVINLGGGVITDMGGFVASTFLRGISFINIPTTLLAMVDAAIGGKTGVNRDHLKNQIGLFSFPVYTLIDIKYLSCLPQNQFKSGLAEMLKHGLIADKAYWETLSDLSQLTLADLEKLIQTSVALKTQITSEDAEEQGQRKLLNFGHTLGHAIESYCLDTTDKTTLLHGEAIAIGMILESYLSVKTAGLAIESLAEIKRIILITFKKVSFTETDITALLKLMKFDKKNSHGQINFVLLEAIGKGKIDCQIEEADIMAAFDYYHQD